MKTYDVTIPIQAEMPVYPGDPPVLIEPRLRLADGDLANVSCYSFGSHTGTHIDPPFHILDDGLTVDQIPLELLIGRTRVVQIGGGNEIDAESLREHDLSDAVRVLFKTRNSYMLDGLHQFVETYVHLTVDAAEYLVNSGIKVVGIDYLSVEKFGAERLDVHAVLLRNGVIIIEGLNLKEVEPGDYEMICLPLKIKDGDGAPARVILRA
jgi:arylformamidase